MDYDSVADAFRDLRSEVDELEDAVKNGTPEQRGLELSLIHISRCPAQHRNRNTDNQPITQQCSVGCALDVDCRDRYQHKIDRQL